MSGQQSWGRPGTRTVASGWRSDPGWAELVVAPRRRRRRRRDGLKILCTGNFRRARLRTDAPIRLDILSGHPDEMFIETNTVRSNCRRTLHKYNVVRSNHDLYKWI